MFISRSPSKKAFSSLFQSISALALLGTFALGCSATPEGDPNDPNNPNNPDNAGPHALGTITLGEAHPPGGGTSKPAVSAGFLPDAKAIKKCTTTVAGCQVAKAPKCSTGTGTGCGAREVCKYDDNCLPKCEKLCDARCSADEECYFPSPDSPSCRKRETFDAGAINFMGTSQSLTLFPPYSYSGMGDGAPFSPMATITVKASGATAAGFEPFTESYTATTYLQTSPSLDKLTKSQVFGSGNIDVKWAAGADRIVITGTGPGGTLTCEAADAAGSFSIPREVLTQVIGDPAVETQFLSLSVSRQRKEIRRDKKTKGMLLTQTVQPSGWLELVTTSSEAQSYQGCFRGQALCTDTCADFQTSQSNCGKCGNACDARDYCRSGTCAGPYACSKCQADALGVGCKAEVDACKADTACNTLYTCIQACTDTTCVNKCSTMAMQPARDKYNTIVNCLNRVCMKECNR